jgi:hypothetical protein
LGKSSHSNDTPLIYRIYKYIIIVIAILLVLRYLYQNSSLFFRKNIVMPFSLHLNERDLYMIKGEEFHLYVYDINKRVSFSTTNFRVAGVNFNGRVFAYNTGKAFIIAKVDKKELRCRVHVIDINKDALKLSAGETYKLKIKGSRSLVSWKSGDRKIATVSMFGKVTAKSRGSTVITAKIKGRTLKCKVVVD